MEAIGEMFDASRPGGRPFWIVGFRCPLHPDEVIRIWQPEFDEVIEAVLTGAPRADE